MKRAEQGDFRVFNMLTSDERVDYVIRQADYYGYSGSRVKGLIFCSSVKEAEMLSSKFNEKGFGRLRSPEVIQTLTGRMPWIVWSATHEWTYWTIS